MPPLATPSQSRMSNRRGGPPVQHWTDRQRKQTRRLLKKMRDVFGLRLQQYTEQCETRGDRNRLSKTGPDATVMRMRDAHRNKGNSNPYTNWVARGLRDGKLVMLDAHTGLQAEIRQVLQRARWQRCLVPCMRNLVVPFRIPPGVGAPWHHLLRAGGTTTGGQPPGRTLSQRDGPA